MKKIPPGRGLTKSSYLLVTLGFLAGALLIKRKKQSPFSPGLVILEDAKIMIQSIGQTYSRPYHWKKQEYRSVGAVLGGLLIIFCFDEALSDLFRQQEKTALPAFKDFGWYYGSPENHYAINGGFYLFGLLTQREEVRKTGIFLITASLAAGILQTFLKVMIGRARPLRNEGKASFNPYSKENSFYSFPSGHTILSFTTVYALGRQVENMLIRNGLYTLGFIAPFSRLWAGAHWVTDAVASICISVPLVKSIEQYLTQAGHLAKDKKQLPVNLKRSIN